MEPDEIIHTRLNEHGEQIRQQGERLNTHAQRIDGLSLVVMGDKTMQIDGLVDRTRALETLTNEIQQWRHQFMFVARIGLALLGLVGIGTWIPYIRILLDLVGG